jgi:hypothetical protein
MISVKNLTNWMFSVSMGYPYISTGFCSEIHFYGIKQFHSLKHLEINTFKVTVSPSRTPHIRKHFITLFRTQTLAYISNQVTSLWDWTMDSVSLLCLKDNLIDLHII